ncbi:hypothetical protein RSSM_00845 [Rhodopirellula sallentina SM41]|uniref:Uncharacterized protein n=1 Tax=Rhodopirellula sallentina SM41 TaxID=1263870 RepID=M5UIT2_9BACT|nr:hypothetical protein RSSM_00845 [Rhodopirellula sallentina SM41]
MFASSGHTVSDDVVLVTWFFVGRACSNWFRLGLGKTELRVTQRLSFYDGHGRPVRESIGWLVEVGWLVELSAPNLER